MTSRHTCDAAFSTAASFPEAASLQRPFSFDLVASKRLGAAEIRVLHEATAAATAGLLARLAPPEALALLGAADDAAVEVTVAELGAELLELVAAEAGALVDDDERLLPQPAMTAAATASVASVLIMSPQ
jgi:hypothetical protein